MSNDKINKAQGLINKFISDKKGMKFFYDNGLLNNKPSYKLQKLGPVLEQTYIGSRKYHNFSKSLNGLYKMEDLKKDFNNYNVYHTVGDGTCFIHSFLFSISNLYRDYLTDKEKSEVGQQFRKEYYYGLVNRLDTNAKYHDGSLYFQNTTKKIALEFIESDRWFEDSHILLFLRVMDFVNIISFSIGQITIPKRMDSSTIGFIECNEDYPAIVHYNTSKTHYSVVSIDDGINYILHNNEYTILKKKYVSETSTVNCQYNDGDIIVYHGKKYKVVDRHFDDNLVCDYYNVKECNKSGNIQSGAKVIRINVADLTNTNSSNSSGYNSNGYSSNGMTRRLRNMGSVRSLTRRNNRTNRNNTEQILNKLIELLGLLEEEKGSKDFIKIINDEIERRTI